MMPVTRILALAVLTLSEPRMGQMACQSLQAVIKLLAPALRAEAIDAQAGGRSSGLAWRPSVYVGCGAFG